MDGNITIENSEKLKNILSYILGYGLYIFIT